MLKSIGIQPNAMSGTPTPRAALFRLSAERHALPAAVGFAQQKVFEDEWRLAGGKWSGAGWARYLRIDALR